MANTDNFLDKMKNAKNNIIDIYTRRIKMYIIIGAAGLLLFLLLMATLSGSAESGRKFFF